MRLKLPALLSFAATAWAPGSMLSAQAPALDACSVLTREEIAAATKRDPGPPDPGTPSGYTTCAWGGASPTGRVALYSNVDPKEPKGLALKQLRDRGMNARAIDDLGDDAVFLAHDEGKRSGTMFVRVGRWRAVITQYAEPDATAESTLPALTAFAQAAVPKMRSQP